jgi:drug/metabolite transporter (DMT)-like permease
MAAFGALTALAAAAVWGGGDFSGGVGVKAAGGSTTGALRVVSVAHALSLAAILAALCLWPSPFPQGTLLAWGLIGGCSQALSLTLFYMALARGAMGASAAVSGLIAASIPAIASSWIEGVPAGIRLAGFALAAAAIWLIAAGPTPADTTAEHRRTTMLLAVIGGVGFGFFFLTMRKTNSLGLLTQMALVRGACLVGCMAMLIGLRWSRREKQIPSGNDSKKNNNKSKTSNGWLNRTALLGALGVAVLDTGGNMLFTLATRLGRLDVAAVLASLYPAGTILLAAWWLHERPTRRQGLGMAVALAAVVLITV